MKMPDLRCALMDIGTVLVKIDMSRLVERVEPLIGIGPDQLRSAFAAENLVFRYESGQIGDSEFLGEIGRRFHREIARERFEAAWNSIFVSEPLIGEDLLASLAARLDLWLISNTNPIHFEYIRKHYGFFGHFKGWVLSYESGALKPDPAIFERAVQTTGVEPGRTLFVDDLQANVEAARNLGFHSLQFVDATGFEAQLRSLGLIE
jgi:HAD superfamily hydrolase (TIGR01509 family)